MNIPIGQFEQHIDGTILKRGFTYFKDGSVIELEEMTSGVYNAIVSGSEDYTVELKIENKTVTEHICSCPYDIGPICKHVAAVLFYLQQDLLGLNSKDAQVQKLKEKASTKRATKTVTEQVAEILDKSTYDELKQFICEKTERDPVFRNTFLSSFAHKNTHESKELYVKQINEEAA